MKIFSKGLILGVLMVLGGLAVTASAVFADDWWWNARVKTGATEVRLIWQVADNHHNPNSYSALVNYYYPQKADVALINKMTNNEEVYFVPTEDLAISERGIEVQAEFLITPLEKVHGQNVVAYLVANGVIIGTVQGELGRAVVVSGILPPTQ